MSEEDDIPLSKRSAIALGCGCLGLIGLILSGGCIVIHVGDTYEGGYPPEIIEGEFVPAPGIARQWNTSTYPFFKIYTYDFPKDFQIYHGTYANQDPEGAAVEFVVTKVLIAFEGEDPVTFEGDSLDFLGKPIKVNKEERTPITEVINMRKDLTLGLDGYALDSEGNRIPFSVREDYEYRVRFAIYPIIFEFLSV